MTNDIEELEDLIPDISLELKEQFIEFFELIEQYNTRINLVAKSTIPKAGLKHFSDSYMALKIIEDSLVKGSPIFDFGAGNGFPGIIAAMMFPDESVILVERDQRKAEFLKMAASKLGLDRVEVHPGNVSDLADGSCVNVISRAMAPLPKFLLLTRAVMAEGGKAFLFKGDHWSTEFSQVEAQVFDYWEVELKDAYELPKNDGTRFVVQCTKI